MHYFYNVTCKKKLKQFEFVVSYYTEQCLLFFWTWWQHIFIVLWLHQICVY